MTDVVPQTSEVIPAGTYRARVGGIRETRTHENGRLTGMYLDWQFVIAGGAFDGARLVGRTGTAFVPYSRLWAWTAAASRHPLQRHHVFRAEELRGRPVMLDVIQTPRKDGDGVMNAVAAVKGRMAG